MLQNSIFESYRYDWNKNVQDNFYGYWLVIKYRIIIVMFTIDENRVFKDTLARELFL